MKILKFEMDNEEFFIELTDGILKSGKIQKDKITYNLEPEEEKLLKIICQKIFDNKFELLKSTYKNALFLTMKITKKNINVCIKKKNFFIIYSPLLNYKIFY